MEHNYQRWFVNGTYQYAGAPKLEQAVFSFAEKRYLHTIIYEADINKVVADIKAKAELLHRENKKCKPVEVSDSRNPLVPESRNIRIGEHFLNLTKVKEELEYIQNDNVLKL